jgi:SH3-like domain-containing protein
LNCFLIALFCLVAGFSARGQAVCARSTATLRKGPGSQFEKTWTVSKYMPFVVMEQKGAWSKLSDIDGEIHWALSSNFTRSFRCVAVKSNTVETRQGPGTQFPYGDLKTLDKYTPLKRYDSKNGWLEVENDLGQRVWVSENKVWKPIRVQTLSF